MAVLAASATPDPHRQAERTPACGDLGHNELHTDRSRKSYAPTANIARMCAEEMNYKVHPTDRYAFLGMTYTNTNDHKDMQAVMEPKLHQNSKPTLFS